MRKMTALLLPAVLLGLSTAVLASPSEPPAAGNQSTSLSVSANAYIPCYLEMSFEGNGINQQLISIGTGVKATSAVPSVADPHCIIFSPGTNDSTYINGNWEPLGIKALAPGPDVFISACGTFKTTIWSNIDYTYAVTSSDLVGEGTAAGATLPLYMRYKFDGETDYEAASRLGSAPIVALPAAPAHNRLSTSVILQQFRVPFDKTVAAGKYSGTIDVTAFTL